MHNLELKLNAALYRFACPETTELNDYHLGLLNSERNTAVATHLVICPHCTGELAELETFLTAVAPDLEVSLVEKIKVWIAQLIPDTNTDGFLLEPAFGLRGQEQEAAEGPLFYTAGDADLTLEIQQDLEHPGHKLIAGHVLGIDSNNAQAQLQQDEKLVSTVPVSEFGHFTLSNLASGNYMLVLSGPEFEIHVTELSVP